MMTVTVTMAHGRNNPTPTHPHPHPTPPTHLMHITQFSIDASPSYMLQRSTVANIASMLPHAKIIVALREPVERMMSE